MSECDFLEEFAINLKDIMSEQDINQNLLSKKTGLARSTICKYLNAKSMPSTKALVNISIALDCEIDDLIPTYNFIDIWLEV